MEFATRLGSSARATRKSASSKPKTRSTSGLLENWKRKGPSRMSPAMRLELADFPVREIRLGKSFSYHDAILEVDQQELTGLLSQDPRIDVASIAVVHPGE